MRVSPWSVVAAAAAVLTAGAVTPAIAGDDQPHVLTVQLPGGGVERIQYTGDVAPRIVLVPTSSMMAQPDPFAALERISAMMQQQQAIMLQQMQMLDAAPFAAGGLSFVSATSGSGVCMHSVRITYNGGDAAPHVVSSTSGDCGPAHAARPRIETIMPAPTRHEVPNTIEVKADQTPEASPAKLAWNR